jgi:hypothetical protein
MQFFKRLTNLDPTPRYWGLSRRELALIVLLFLITRMALMGGALIANRFIPGLYGPYWPRLTNRFTDVWYRWDAGFYTAISLYGYDFAYNHHIAGDIGFMPLYPALMHLALPLVGCFERGCDHNPILPFLTGRDAAIVAGVMVSNFALIGTALLFYDLVKRRFDPSIAMRSTILLLIAPNSIFFSGVYTESLFMLWVMLVFQALDRDRFAWAVVFASAACLTREVGLALFLPLVVYAWKQPGPKRWLGLIGAGLAPLTFALYIITAGILAAGDWLTYFTANALIWKVSLASGPYGAILPYLPPYAGKEYISWWGAGPTWLNLASALVYLLLVIPAFRQDVSFGLFSLLCVIIPITGGTLISMPRFGGVIFSQYIAGAQWANTKQKQWIIYAGFALAAAFFTARFVTWRWMA